MSAARPDSPTPGPAAESDPGDASPVDSRWWYVVAATPVFAIVSGVFVVWLIAAVFLGIGFAPDAVGAVGIVVVLAFAVVGLVGLALSIAFPAAIYLDAEAVADADVGWEPDSVLYALVAAISAIASAFTLSLVVAVYYLYRRHQHVGVP